jgi:hypothetical protein
LNIGKIFAKRWFDIDLNFEFKNTTNADFSWTLDQLLKDSIKVGNEEIISLVYQQIHEGINFLSTNVGGLTPKIENPRHRSWITAEVIKFQYKGEDGYILTSDNVMDLANRLHRNPSQFTSRTLQNILRTEWDSKEHPIILGSFWVNHQTTYGIFIPCMLVDKIEVTTSEVEKLVENYQENPI